MQLKLFTTSFCHLCEIAESILLSLEQTQHFIHVDISDNDLLIDAYGHRIPVLQRSDTLAELNWPFSTDDIINFLER
ncbi:MAG: glutaredoxin family protein [Methylotenera sp.]|jgi:Glutaredoxin-like domain (DUF836)